MNWIQEIWDDGGGYEWRDGDWTWIDSPDITMSEAVENQDGITNLRDPYYDALCVLRNKDGICGVDPFA